MLRNCRYEELKDMADEPEVEEDEDGEYEIMKKRLRTGRR